MSQTGGPKRPNMFRKLLAESGDEKSLTARGKRAGSWATIGFAGKSILRLGSNLILTRLLTPEIFGLMALAQVFLNGVLMLSDVGVRASVIRSKRGEDPMFLNTAWTIQIVRGTIITTLCCLWAWPASQIYNEPVLFPLICVLAFSALIAGFRSISVATANRKLLIKNIVFLDISSKIFTLTVTIVLAWITQSVWALAVGIILGGIMRVLLSHIIMPPFPHRIGMEREAVGEIIRFGAWILLGTFFGFLAGRGQQVLYGLLVPIEVIGLISIAILIASIPRDLFQKLISTVILPSFSELVRERPHALPHALRKVRLVTIGVGFPLLFGISFLAQPIVDVLYDDRYAAAGIILTLAALNAAIPILSNTYENLLLAEGRSNVHAALMFGLATLSIIGIFVGFNVYGLVGSLVGIALSSASMFMVNAIIAQRRGYATGRLDFMAFCIVVTFYSTTLWMMDAPAEFTSAELMRAAVAAAE